MVVASWNTLEDGREYIFGFLQIDTVKSSQLAGPDTAIQETKERLGELVTSVLEHSYGAKRLMWLGDGGAYLFLTDDPGRAYDNMVVGALHVLYELSFFNGMRGHYNALADDIRLRISCHEGRLIWSSEAGYIHGKALNYFLKNEREIGQDNKVVITEEVFNRLGSVRLRDDFVAVGSKEFKVGEDPYANQLYEWRGSVHRYQFTLNLDDVTLRFLDDQGKVVRQTNKRRIVFHSPFQTAVRYRVMPEGGGRADNFKAEFGQLNSDIRVYRLPGEDALYVDHYLTDPKAVFKAEQEYEQSCEFDWLDAFCRPEGGWYEYHVDRPVGEVIAKLIFPDKRLPRVVRLGRLREARESTMEERSVNRAEQEWKLRSPRVGDTYRWSWDF